MEGERKNIESDEVAPKKMTKKLMMTGVIG